MKLNDLGHSQFLAESSLRPIYCSDGEEKVHLEVIDTQKAVREWQKEISELRSNYTWLLYFSIPKMLLLYRHIKSHSHDIDAIVHEVSFVVYNQEIERRDLQCGVEVSFKIHLNVPFTCMFPLFAFISWHLKRQIQSVLPIQCKLWVNSWRICSAILW